MNDSQSTRRFFPRDTTHGPVPGTPEYDDFIDDQLTIIKADYLRSIGKLTPLADEIFTEVGPAAAAILSAIQPDRALRVLDICCGIGLAVDTLMTLGVSIDSLTLTEQDARILERTVAFLEERGHRSKIRSLTTTVFDPNVHRLADAPRGPTTVISCNAFQHFASEHQKRLIREISINRRTACWSHPTKVHQPAA